MNHVLIHQSIIGLETMKQFDMIDEKPDVMIGCLGGGSNFGGFILPFAEKLSKERESADSSQPNQRPHPIFPKVNTSTISEITQRRRLY